MTTAGWRHYRPDTHMANVSNQQLQQSIKLIVEAVKGEKEDQLFYEFLIQEAPTQEEKEMITTIRDDEAKHNRMFRQLYKELTKKELPSDVTENFTPPASYLEGIKQALFGELKAVEKYRTIRSGLPKRQERDILFEIITDEIKHASKYNYLFTLNWTASTIRKTDEQPTIDENDEMTTKGANRKMSEQNQTILAEGEQRETIQNTQTLETKNLRQESAEMSLAEQWRQYIQPLVQKAVQDAEEGRDLTELFQKYILAGVLVGNQFTHEQAFRQLEEWEENSDATP
ncbi:ferritin family protein [Pseudoneobacillus sp. C159]